MTDNAADGKITVHKYMQMWPLCCKELGITPANARATRPCKRTHMHCKPHGMHIIYFKMIFIASSTSNKCTQAEQFRKSVISPFLTPFPCFVPIRLAQFSLFCMCVCARALVASKLKYQQYNVILAANGAKNRKETRPKWIKEPRRTKKKTLLGLFCRIVLVRLNHLHFKSIIIIARRRTTLIRYWEKQRRGDSTAYQKCVCWMPKKYYALGDFCIRIFKCYTISSECWKWRRCSTSPIRFAQAGFSLSLLAQPVRCRAYMCVCVCVFWLSECCTRFPHHANCSS